MPLPNGVDPFGVIAPICPSAAFLGNRGILHDESGQITKRWKHNQWRSCALHFKGRSLKPLMQPGRYSELFFLDEATALSAGHRPCGECRKSDYEKFMAAWNSSSGERMSIKDVDRRLHSERFASARDETLAQKRMDELPDGVMVVINDQAFLIWKGNTLAWSPKGYSRSEIDFPGSQVVSILTPASIVSVLRSGYIVGVHESACLGG